MDIQQLIDNYANWLKSEITFEKFGEYYEITTPYLDNANDYLQIYVRQDGDDILFTDDGATVNGLEMNGFQLTSARKSVLKSILFQYGVSLNNRNELVSRGNAHNFPQKKHMFVQAMMRVDDLFLTAKSKAASFFLDDIQEYFMAHEIFYTDNVQFTGTSGFSHNYDFLLQRSRTKPERLCRTLNNPNKSNMGNILFAWGDTKPSRRGDSQLIVFLNDINPIAKGVEEAFANYSVNVIKWSEREQQKNLDILIA